MMKELKFDLIGKRKIWYGISILILVVGIFSFIFQGLNLGIDFTGGTLIEIEFVEDVPVDELRTAIDSFGDHSSTVQATDDGSYNIRSSITTTDESDALIADLTETFGENTILRNELVGPTIGKELTLSAILALVIASILMVIYITVRFQFLFGITSIITLLHDAFVVLMVYSLFQLEVGSSFIAAILTVIGYSINATIVIFDRVRESQPLYKKADFQLMINNSVMQTLARSINTILTTVFTLLALYFFGGETTKIFVLAMLVGILSGGYSSVFIAGPLYADLKTKFGKKD